MHGRRKSNAPTSAGSFPWVSTCIVEAAALCEICPCAVAPPHIRRGLGENRAPFGLRSLRCSWT